MKFKFNVEKDDQHKDIEEIYKDEDGNPVDMTKMDKGSRARHIMIWLAGIAVLLILAGIAGWFVFNRQTSDGGDVLLMVEAPSEIASGETIDITVTLKNEELKAWRRADLSMRLPNGFYIIGTNPDPTEGRDNVWELGTVDPGKQKEIHIRGQLVGSVDDEKEFYAMLTYEPENFKYEFQKTASAKVKIATSTIEAEIEAPTRATSTEEITYKAILLNTSDLPVEHARVYLEVPDNFKQTSLGPEDSSEYEWDFKDWDPRDLKEIILKGTLSEEDGETQEFGLKVNIVESDGNETRQVEKFTIVQIVNPELEIEAAIDGSTEDALVSEGDDKELEITLQNNSDLVMRNVQIEVQADPEDAIGPVSLFEEAYPITYTSAEYLELEELEPNDRATFVIPFHVLEELAGENITAKFTIRIKQAEIDGNVVEEGLPSTQIAVKVPTDLELSTFARYYSDFDEAIGSGPHPPIVGETTEYAIFWTLENTYNEASEVKVTAKLPNNAEFGDERRVDEGTLSYDNATRTLTWTIQKISANTEIDAYFTVMMTPEEQDLGTLLILTRVAEMEGRDIWAAKELSDSEEGVTSELLGDPQEEGDGLVEKH